MSLMPSLLRLMKRAQSSFVGLSLISKYCTRANKESSLQQKGIGGQICLEWSFCKESISLFEKLNEKSLFMDTYLNSLDRVALNIELRLENDLKQALDLDEVEPAWQQDWVLNVDAQVLAHERDIVRVCILLQQCVDELGTLLTQSHCKFILTSVRSNKFQHYGLNFFPIFKFKQVDVFD